MNNDEHRCPEGEPFRPEQQPGGGPAVMILKLPKAQAWHLEVAQRQTQPRIFIDVRDIPITFCPFCGLKLGG